LPHSLFHLCKRLGSGRPDALSKVFKSTESARPRLVALDEWKYYPEGIKLRSRVDASVGNCGYQNFDAGSAAPQVVDKRLAYMRPDGKRHSSNAIHLGDQFGMEMAIAGSPGWSETGGRGCPISGNEKVCLERNSLGGRKAFHGKLALLQQHWRLSEWAFREEFGRPPAATSPGVLC